MKTIGLLLFALLAKGISQETGVAPQADTGEHKPCGVHLKVSPASEEDIAAFRRILNRLHVDLDVLLYVSHDPMVRNYGGAMSFRCKVDNHEIYETYENWTIYDPEIIQGDAARDFVFAHEIAHHLNGDTSSGRPPSSKLELRADSNGALYLISLGWTEARLLHALDLLDLPQGSQPGYPTTEERKAMVKMVAEPSGPSPPSNLKGGVLASESPSYEELWDRLLNLKLTGSIQLQSVRTLKYVCAVGTPDPKIPSTSHFAFFDNCEQGRLASFDIEVSPNGIPGYWIQQRADPCPGYAANCAYALKSVGSQLEFWNQDLAADRDGWEKELGEQEVFSFEAADSLGELVRIKAHEGGYIFVDRETAQLKGGGSREQAAEFRVAFDPCGGNYLYDGEKLTCE